MTFLLTNNLFTFAPYHSLLVLISCIFFITCLNAQAPPASSSTFEFTTSSNVTLKRSARSFFPSRRSFAHTNNIMAQLQKATFGGGCFWGMEKWFRKEFPDLAATAVGYLGGTTKNPTYRQVCTGTTGHAEVLEVQYDPEKVKYRDLLTFFFRIHDPTTLNRQGNDVGTQYRSAIFYHTPEQEREAKEVKEEMQNSGKFSAPIVTEISPASEFYKAEDYHQLYLETNPGGYCNHKPRW